MGKTPQRRAGGPIPTWKPGDKTLTIADLAQALAPIAPDVAGTVQRIRHWTREHVLFPIHQAHAGPGKHRAYTEDAIYECAALHVLTTAGLPVSGPRLLLDAITAIRQAVPKWRKTRDPEARLILPMTVTGTVRGPAVYWKGEKVESLGIFKAADVVFRIELELGKVFAMVDRNVHS